MMQTYGNVRFVHRKSQDALLAIPMHVIQVLIKRAIDSCLYYFVKNSLVALLEAICSNLFRFELSMCCMNISFLLCYNHHSLYCNPRCPVTHWHIDAR